MIRWGLALIAVILCNVGAVSAGCVHEQMILNTTLKYYDDQIHHTGKERLLQTVAKDKIRIFMDYTQLVTGGLTEQNTIKRIMNITAAYFYNILKVERLSELKFPANTSLQCNVLSIPSRYVTEGAIGDLGIVVGNQNNSAQSYVAKSTSCTLLKSNNRPLWGMIMWNNVNLKYDQVGFQQIVYVGIHEVTHILAFSALLYELYPLGNPYRKVGQNQYLTSKLIVAEMNNHFNCNKSEGLLLEDQDGTLIPSHPQRKVVGTQFMIAANKKGAYFSRTTLALFDSTGWYEADYKFAQPTTWGKGKGCEFINVDNCRSDEFCNNNDFSCDWDGTAQGKCSSDVFAGSCKLVNYYTNTICLDESFELKNLNAALDAKQRGGAYSRCFASNYRAQGKNSTVLNLRCYVTICSVTGSYIYVLVNNFIIVCRRPGQVVPAPTGLIGNLTCPSNFDNYCQSKKTCAYNCNKNGACINGQCLCTGQTALSATCLDESILTIPVGTTGGLTKSLRHPITGQSLTFSLGQNVKLGKDSNGNSELKLTQTSINTKCIAGTFRDEYFGECLKCRDFFGCDYCAGIGCLSCPNGDPAFNGRCRS